jgi:5-methylcytosine-specific restriction endonuclease McrA
VGYQPTAPASAADVAKAAYNDAAWLTLRRLILERDAYLCQIRKRGCTSHATQVDHITALAHGGARLDPANLRAACIHCNASEGAIVGNRKREPRTVTW